MISIESPSRLRLINLLIPPSNDPLLTPYTKQINPKILPLKKSFSILSNIRQNQKLKQPKIQLSSQDYVKINRSYQSLKRFKKSFNEKNQNEEQKNCDPQYLNLIELRKSILIKKKRQESISFRHSKTDLEQQDSQSIFCKLKQHLNLSKQTDSKDKYSFINKNPRYAVPSMSKPKSARVNTSQEQFSFSKQQRYSHRR